ncbi:shikimate kinase [Deinobacterium chartae]|uniref:Shikimate kinase n=1 Tax=Deinobacterium chartae TaxID=521158 RepID=A0A841HXV4_9DEIO|nr:shikimate kinase [Deinobacterium chartae]MBB6097703.1 shikimate kinase [Deinobacterium chartae]
MSSSPRQRRPVVTSLERPVRWVALAGFMGTGKSRIGWELSRRLALHFVDTDKVIERVTGLAIPQIFELYGEETFREYESEILRRVTRLDLVVVSLGGGSFVKRENQELLLARGPVVVLSASPETIYRRTRRSSRPLLKTEDPIGRIRTLLEARSSAYARGDIFVSTDGRDSAEVVEEIVEKLWEYADDQTES